MGWTQGLQQANLTSNSIFPVLGPGFLPVKERVGVLHSVTHLTTLLDHHLWCARYSNDAAVNKIQSLQSQRVCRESGWQKPSKAVSKQIADVMQARWVWCRWVEQVSGEQMMEPPLNKVAWQPSPKSCHLSRDWTKGGAMRACTWRSGSAEKEQQVQRFLERSWFGVLKKPQEGQVGTECREVARGPDYLSTWDYSPSDWEAIRTLRARD